MSFFPLLNTEEDILKNVGKAGGKIQDKQADFGPNSPLLTILGKVAYLIFLSYVVC